MDCIAVCPASLRIWRTSAVWRTALFAATTLLVLIGGGCGTVPDAAIAKHARIEGPPEFKNASEPVSQRTSAAIVAELKRRHGELDILDRQIAIETSARSGRVFPPDRTGRGRDRPRDRQLARRARQPPHT